MKDSSNTFVDQAGKPLSLLLYKRNSCPYCHVVMDRAHELGLDLPMRDTERDAGARSDLIAKGGKSQVPCLFINDKPLYESMDIVHFLENEVKKS